MIQQLQMVLGNEWQTDADGDSEVIQRILVGSDFHVRVIDYYKRRR